MEFRNISLTFLWRVSCEKMLGRISEPDRPEFLEFSLSTEDSEDPYDAVMGRIKEVSDEGDKWHAVITPRFIADKTKEGV